MLSLKTELYKNNFLRKYLEKAPISLALVRAAECNELSEDNYLRPVLDIGCGSGLFTSILFNDSLDVGLDVSFKEIKEAKKTLKYKYLVVGSIEKTSFENESFSTIFSNSVVEHLDNLDKALKEILRILKKDGIFIFTTYTEAFGDNLFYRKILVRMGLYKIADLYSKTIHRVYNHQNLLSHEEWERILTENGFQVIEFKEYLPEKVMKKFDLFLPFSLFNLLWMKIFNKWKPFSTKFLAAISFSLLKNSLIDDKCNCCGLKFIVKKL